MSRIVLSLLCLLPFLIQPAAAKQPPEFKEAYKAYTELVENGKTREAIPYAEKALDIALKSDAFDDETRGMLAFNLGYVNFQDNQLSASVEAFTKAIELLEKTANTDLKAEALVYRGIAYRHLFKFKQARADLERALPLLEGDHPTIRLVRADALENLAWVEISDRRPEEAQKYAAEAYTIYSKLLGNRHPRTLRALIAISASKYLGGDRGEARDLLARAVELAEGVSLPDGGPEAKAESDQFSYFELYRFHREVAAFYELMGRERDARYHERIAAGLREGTPPPSRQVTPIERRPPTYPRRALNRRLTGWVIVEYTVRKDGTTADIEIIDAAPEGWFESTVRATVKDWKYKPPMKDGKPVEVRDVRTTIRFMLSND